jgi:hypothetical protein
MNNQDPKYDVKTILEIQTPYLIKLLNGKHISWTTINRNLKKHHQFKKDKYKSGEIIDINIFSMINQFILKNENSFGMFDFFNFTFKQLFYRLTNKELEFTHKIIKCLLTNLDYKYLNFIGEIATLNAYMSSGNFELLNIEEKIYPQNNVQADLFLKRKKDGLKFLVEIVNIHIENKNFTTINEMEIFIGGKFREKHKNTFFGDPYHNLTIQPVIWINTLEQIKILESIFKKYEKNVKDIRMPMCCLTYQESDGNYEHRFEHITTILDEK